MITTHHIDFLLLKKDKKRWRSNDEYIVVIDGEATRENFDPEVLKETAEKEGEFDLFTCSCGQFGCGGYTISIRKDSTHVIFTSAVDEHGKKVESIPFFAVYFPELKSADRRKTFDSRTGEATTLGAVSLKFPIMFTLSEYEDMIERLKIVSTKNFTEDTKGWRAIYGYEKKLADRIRSTKDWSELYRAVRSLPQRMVDPLNTLLDKHATFINRIERLRQGHGSLTDIPDDFEVRHQVKKLLQGKAALAV